MKDVLYNSGMDKSIAQMLKEIIAATHWRQVAIATKIGVSQATVNRLINGQIECKSRTYRNVYELYVTVSASHDKDES